MGDAAVLRLGHDRLVMESDQGDQQACVEFLDGATTSTVSNSRTAKSSPCTRRTT